MAVARRCGGNHDASNASPGAKRSARKAPAMNRIVSASQNEWTRPKTSDNADQQSRPV